MPERTAPGTGEAGVRSPGLVRAPGAPCRSRPRPARSGIRFANLGRRSRWLHLAKSGKAEPGAGRGIPAPPPGAPIRRGSGPNAAARSRGFSLLETMVALVIFSGAAMALYGLLNTNLAALARVHDVSRQMPAVRQAVEHLSSINPRERDSGRIEIDGLDVAWSARLLQPARDSQTATGGRGYFEVGLYEVEFTMSEAERSLGTWRMRVAGYERVRESDF